MRTLLLCPDPRAVRLFAPHLPDVRISPIPVSGRWQLVIRWGTSDGDDGPERLLNSARALRGIRHARDVADLCSANRIPAKPILHGTTARKGMRSSELAGHFRIDLFDLATVAVFRWDGSRYKAFAWKGSSRLAGLRQMARRALYAANLHFGAVFVGRGGEGGWRVLGIDPAPPLSPALAKRYAAAFTEYAQSIAGGGPAPTFSRSAGDDGSPAPGPSPAHGADQRPVDIILGCDPEFVLRRRRTGRLVPASSFFPRWGQVGLDRIVARAKGTYFHPIAELRPAPSPSPHELVDNLRRAMARAAWLVRGRDIRFEAGSLGAPGFPIGGHIHLSNIRPTTDLLLALDNYLTVPLLLLEDSAAARARRPRYGTLGEFRLQRHGGFEYRTPPSWIFSPEFALAVLCLAKIIAAHYPVLRRIPLAGPDAQRDFYNARKDRFRAAFPALWADITATPSYLAYASELDLLRRLVERERCWHERNDIKKRWLKPSGGEF